MQCSLTWPFFAICRSVVLRNYGTVGNEASEFAGAFRTSRALEPHGAQPLTQRPSAGKKHASRIACRHRLMSAVLLLAQIVIAIVVAPSAGATITSYGPANPSWINYYSNPDDSGTWLPFCKKADAPHMVPANGVPACGPTGSAQIALPGGPPPSWSPVSVGGFQCVELAERYLYVKFGSGWAADGFYKTGANLV